MSFNVNYTNTAITNTNMGGNTNNIDSNNTDTNDSNITNNNNTNVTNTVGCYLCANFIILLYDQQTFCSGSQYQTS